MLLAVLVTIPEEKAETLTKILLKARVCACVNIIQGIKSYFWWQDKIDFAKEAYLIIKTKATEFKRLEKLIKANHPYQVPEIIAFKMDKANKLYADWLNQQVK